MCFATFPVDSWTPVCQHLCMLEDNGRKSLPQHFLMSLPSSRIVRAHSECTDGKGGSRDMKCDRAAITEGRNDVDWKHGGSSGQV